MIHLASDGWLIPIIISSIIVIGLVFWLYKTNPAGKQTPFACYLLKTLAMILLLICLLNPQMVSRDPKKGDTRVIVWADNSKFMVLKTPGDEKIQADVLKTMVEEGKTTWLNELNEQFDLTRYMFSNRLNQFTDEKKFDFSGNATDLLKHLKDISNRFDQKKTGGIILLTDGLFTDREKANIDYSKLPAVFPVVLKNKEEVKDLWVKNVDATVSSFEDAQVSLKVDIGSVNYLDREIMVEVLDEADEVVASKKYSQEAE